MRFVFGREESGFYAGNIGPVTVIKAGRFLSYQRVRSVWCLAIGRLVLFGVGLSARARWC